MFYSINTSMRNVRPWTVYENWYETLTQSTSLTASGVDTGITPGPNNCIIVSGTSNMSSGDTVTFDTLTYDGNDCDEQVSASDGEAALLAICRHTANNVDVVYGHTENADALGIFVYFLEGVQDPRAFLGTDTTINGGTSDRLDMTTFFDGTNEQFDGSAVYFSNFNSNTNGIVEVTESGIGGSSGFPDKEFDINDRENNTGMLTILSYVDLWGEATDMNLVASLVLTSNNNNRQAGCAVTIR